MDEQPDGALGVDASEATTGRRVAKIQRPAGAAEGAPDAPQGPEKAGRRGFIRLAAAAAAGAAVASLTESSPAAAVTGQPLLIGVGNNMPDAITDITGLTSPSATNLMPVAFRVANFSGSSAGPNGTQRVAIFGNSSDNDAGGGLRVGVLGVTSPFSATDKRGVGVYGTSNNATLPDPAAPVGVFGLAGPDALGNGTAVLGQGEGAATGVKGTSTTGTGVSGDGAAYGVAGSSSAANGIGVRALSNNGIGIVATGLGNAINATSVGTGVGINATGVSGVVGTAYNTGDGVSGVSTSGRGVRAHSTSGLDLDCDGTGRVRVKPQVAVGAPIVGTYAAGELILDSAGDLFACVVAGTPGTWHRVGSTTTSPATGVFRPVDPFRAYDSRQVAYPVNGVLTLGTNRVVSIKDAHASDGTLTLADVVPAGASAVTLNLTVVAPTSAAGFLAVTPGDAATYVASSINWSAAGAVIANGGVAKIDSDRQIRVFAGGAIGTVDFVVDITGYYV